jgi:hypothetical protein
MRLRHTTKWLAILAGGILALAAALATIGDALGQEVLWP